MLCSFAPVRSQWSTFPNPKNTKLQALLSTHCRVYRGERSWPEPSLPDLGGEQLQFHQDGINHSDCDVGHENPLCQTVSAQHDHSTCIVLGLSPLQETHVHGGKGTRWARVALGQGCR